MAFKPHTLLFMTAVFAAAGCGPPDSETQAPPAARLELLTGKVYVQSGPDQDYWARAEAGLGLAAGSSLWAREDGRALVRFPDGSTVLLEANSTMQLSRLDPKNIEIRIEFGLLKVWASKAEHREFRVGSRAAVAAVRGTRFRVFVEEAGKTIFDLFEGILEILGADGGKRTLKPRRRLAVRPGLSVEETASEPIPSMSRMPTSPPRVLEPPAPEPAPKPKSRLKVKPKPKPRPKKTRRPKPVKKRTVRELQSMPGYMPGLKEKGMPGIKEKDSEKKWRKDQRQKQGISEP